MNKSSIGTIAALAGLSAFKSFKSGSSVRLDVRKDDIFTNSGFMTFQIKPSYANVNEDILMDEFESIIRYFQDPRVLSEFNKIVMKKFIKIFSHSDHRLDFLNPTRFSVEFPSIDMYADAVDYPAIEYRGEVRSAVRWLWFVHNFHFEDREGLDRFWGEVCRSIPLVELYEMSTNQVVFEAFNEFIPDDLMSAFHLSLDGVESLDAGEGSDDVRTILFNVETGEEYIPLSNEVRLRKR